MRSGGVQPSVTASELAPPLPTRIVLPLDSRIPGTQADRPAVHEETPPWHEPYVTRFIDVHGERERAAWFHFCHGHHVEFLYWALTGLACERVTSAVNGADARAVEHWVTRVCRLVEGSAAMLHYCADLDPTTYDPCLRPSMEAEREDFSGDMSRDFLAMMAAKAAMVESLGGAGTDHEGELKRFKAAERYWHEHHGQVILALHPGKSLLRERVEELKRESESFDYRAYVDTVVRGEKALNDYDDYFGVTRTGSMSIDDYWTQAVEKLATVHRSFAMDSDTRAHLMRGDGVLLAMISERLAEDDST